MKNNIDLTVAIPTYNGAKRLPQLLEKLQNQQGTESFNWEIIVVDNNSHDATASIIKKYQSTWQCHYKLKYVFEPKQGLAYARERAIMESQGKLIAFLDDDNYPNNMWVLAAYKFARNHPHVGAYGSQIHPQWETKPPEEFARITPFLAITERGNIPLLYEADQKLLPPGAGLVINKQAWLECVPNQMILAGRISGNMLAGEDIEMLSYIQRGGWEIWYNPEMEIYHQIPAWRLTREYLIPFFEGIGLSRYVTRMVNIHPRLRPIFSIGYIVNDIRKIIFHFLKYHLRAKTNLVSDCEMQLFISSLISPFYLWFNGYFSHKLKDKIS
ncbi:hormogonium polysaccharide biosynthesis glycosyltransferase HpsE [Calothrix rhizosoleniae]|uniref:hormogonium polysaccharide biosynthesis glycosyltransferase HpsE n=1 Tax=Calothrix rhizosoleniae TaxID=888997 RepID=UPI000B49EF98|nr:hormogonium polysaccharide biosynthesis glycosyltransferase HpsE [Calothrix rhizosoleniae]